MKSTAASHEIIIVCGNAGVGKTTLAKRIAKEKAALLLDLDTVSERLVRAGLAAMGHDPDDRDSPSYKRIYREAIHETLFAIAKENKDFSTSVIVAPFTKERRDPDFLSRCKRELETAVRIVYVVCDEATRKRRIEQRGNPRDRLKLDTWEEYAAVGRDPDRLPFPHEHIDTSDPT